MPTRVLLLILASYVNLINSSSLKPTTVGQKTPWVITNILGARLLRVLYHIAIYVMFWCSAAPVTSAQDLSDRKKLQDTWVTKQKTHHNLYETAPSTHVVPNFNTITYATRGEKIDATISPEDTENTAYRTETLKLSGYTVAPHIAVSLKNFGLGVSAEAGQRRAIYSLSQSDSYFSRQESYLDYRGLGLYLYWIIPQPIKFVLPSLTLGNNSYSVKHKISTFGYDHAMISDNSDSSFKGFNYSVQRYDIGLSLGMKLLKNFTLAPWVNYDIVDTKDGVKQADAAELYDSSHAAILYDDLELFWQSHNRLKYGLDFSVRLFGRVELHLGGLLGLIAATGFDTPAVTDKSVSLGVSFDQKGN